MPKSAEHRVAAARIARERIAAGKPSWAYRINLAGVFHNDSMSFEERRDAVVRIIRASAWFKGLDEFAEVREAVEELGDADDQKWFNDVWDALCDEFDYDRVWVITR